MITEGASVHAAIRPIIAERSSGDAARIGAWVFAGSLAVGTAAALFYASRGLTLSHYDARAHLVVARRVVDSLTPGWRQLGAVWLPLPHLIDLALVPSDWAYRTGAPSVAVSVLALALGLAALARTIVRWTDSAAAAIAAPLLILLNPNVLYLQSTPMTEPLLFGLSLLALEAVSGWIAEPTRKARVTAGCLIAALTLTRYEGWAIAAAFIVIAAAARRRDGASALSLAPYMFVPVLAFFVFSWASTGAWFVSSGFFVADNPARHRIDLVLSDVWTSVVALAGPALAAAALAGVAAAIWRGRMNPARLLPIALLAAAALPVAAFYEGHPHRIRYMIPLVVGGGALAGLAIAAAPRRARLAIACLVCGLAAWERPPLQATAPMVTEAQWETPYRAGREAVTEFLDETYDGTPILASMGSLGHYMQDAASHGYDLADFVHEGNGDLWTAALAAPVHYVRWILIEERAEGGDALAVRARSDPGFLAGFARVAEGGGMALYRRVP